jgi:predicted dehydrogenase
MRTAAAASAALGGLTVLGATPKGEGRTLKVGLVGCGGRGRQAARQILDAASLLNEKLGLGLRVEIAATADWLKDRADQIGQHFGVPADRCHDGPKAYQALIDSDVDIVLLCTPPAFRPGHLEAAVAAGKHVFAEKPAAVDPPGCRRVIAAGEAAKERGLSVVAGTQRRHLRGYIDTQAAAAEGQIGQIVAGRIGWCQRHAGATKPVEPLTLDAFIDTWRDWVQLGGDHIVEQHIHNIDVANWFLGSPPVQAVGFGGRARRPAGNTYDFFSIDFEYPDGVHVHSMCRQIGATHVWVGEMLVGDKVAERKVGDETLRRMQRTVCRGGRFPEEPVVPEEIPQDRRGYVQEHIYLLYHLVKGQPLNQAKALGESTAAAILGRTAAYSGEAVAWADMMESPERKPQLYHMTLTPTAADLEAGTAVLPGQGEAPLAGKPA